MELDAERAAGRIDSSVLASDVAEHMAARGVPFREAHDAVARLVLRAEELDLPLSDLPAGEVEKLAPGAGGAWAGLFDVEQGLERRGSEGGSSLTAVRSQLAAARDRLSRS